MHDRYFVAVFVSTLAFILVSSAAIVAGVLYLHKATCEAHSEVTGQQTKYAVFTCYIDVDGRWMTRKEYKLRFATPGAK